MINKFVLTIIILTFYQLRLPAQISLGTSGKSYSAVEGKIIGIWPHENKNNSVEKLRALRENWGFNYILIAAPYGEPFYTNAKKAGFDSTSIMKQIFLNDMINRREWFWKNIESLGKVWAYYFDEPISREYPYKVIMKLISELSEKRLYPTAKLVVGELDERKAVRFLSTTDAIMYSGYGERKDLGVDQIQTWHDWREYLGEKFSMLWISSNEDSLEYKTLFKAARDLGINSVWLYQYEPMESDRETGDLNLEKFCEAAVENGFMRINKK